MDTTELWFIVLADHLQQALTALKKLWETRKGNEMKRKKEGKWR